MTLRVENIHKNFGFVKAVENFNLQLDLGQIHGLIGTNGAGKSTVIHLISGLLTIDSGKVTLNNNDVSHYPAHKRSLMGLGRTFQKNTIMPNMTAFDNILVVAQTHHKQFWKIWKSKNSDKNIIKKTHDIIEKIGLQHYANHYAHSLPHGAKRLLEIGLCLATQPSILLMDEPLAGMGAEETQKIIQLLLELRKNHAILLVEHDLNAVFQLADDVTVMVNGSIIACDTAQKIRQNKAVQTAYMGEFH